MHWLADFRVMMLVIEFVALSTLDATNIDELFNPISVPSIKSTTQKHKYNKAEKKRTKSSPTSGLTIPAIGNGIFEASNIPKHDDNTTKLEGKYYKPTSVNAQTMRKHKTGLNKQENTFKPKPKFSKGLTIPVDGNRVFNADPVSNILKHEHSKENGEKNYKPVRIHANTIRKHESSLSDKEKTFQFKPKSFQGLTIPVDGNGEFDAGLVSNALKYEQIIEEKNYMPASIHIKTTTRNTKQKKVIKSKPKSSKGLTIPVDGNGEFDAGLVSNALKYEQIIEEKNYMPASIHIKTTTRNTKQKKVIKSKPKSSKGLTIPVDGNGEFDAGLVSNAIKYEQIIKEKKEKNYKPASIHIKTTTRKTKQKKVIKSKPKSSKGLTIPVDANGVFDAGPVSNILEHEPNNEEKEGKNYKPASIHIKTTTRKYSKGLTIPVDANGVFDAGPVLNALKYEQINKEKEGKNYKPASIHIKTTTRKTKQKKMIKSKPKSSKGLTIPVDANGVSDAGPVSNILEHEPNNEEKKEKNYKPVFIHIKTTTRQTKKKKIGLDLFLLSPKGPVSNISKHEDNKEKISKKPEDGYDQINELHRISVFDSSVLPNNGIESLNPERMSIHGQHVILPADLNDLTKQQSKPPSISVFDSSNQQKYEVDQINKIKQLEDEDYKQIRKEKLHPSGILHIDKADFEDGLYAYNNSKTIQGLRRDQTNLSGFQRIPVFDDHDTKSSKQDLTNEILKKKLPKKISKKTSHNVEHGDRFVHRADNTTVADILAQKIRVLCWVMTYPANHERAAKQVKRTWGKRCNLLLFMSTGEDLTLPTVELSVKEGYDYLWGKTREAFKYIYEYHLNDAEWFLKADDDTYVVVENLRFMLTKYDKNDPIYFGFQKRGRTEKFTYMDGGAGYVLSREAVTRFVEDALPDPYLCRRNYGTFAEDEQIAECLRNVGVKAMDTRDSYKRARFFSCPPHHVVSPYTKNFWDNSVHWTPKGRACCSELAISFHHLQPNMMYVLEYFIYHLRPYGISYNFHFHIYHLTKNGTV